MTWRSRRVDETRSRRRDLKELPPEDALLLALIGADLTAWQPLDLSGAGVVSIDAKWERVTVTDPTITPTRFGRVRVSVSP